MLHTAPLIILFVNPVIFFSLAYTQKGVYCCFEQSYGVMESVLCMCTEHEFQLLAKQKMESCLFKCATLGVILVWCLQTVNVVYFRCSFSMLFRVSHLRISSLYFAVSV